jgi:ADP-ribose pyrophosphatase YjhB (NUDIX family)
MTLEKRGPWTVMSRRDVYDNRWIRVTHHEVLTPAGGAGIYGTIHYKNLAIGIVPVDDEGHTYLVGQHRFPLDEYSWEIPEGGGTIGVDPRESAARELREETGLQARNWQQLLRCDLSNSVSDERSVSFLAWGLTQGSASPEPTEQLMLRRVPLSEAFQMVADGEIQDALSVLSLQAVQLLHLQGKLPIRYNDAQETPPPR